MWVVKNASNLSQVLERRELSRIILLVKNEANLSQVFERRESSRILLLVKNENLSQVFERRATLESSARMIKAEAVAAITEP